MLGPDVITALDRLAATSCIAAKHAGLAALLEEPLFALVTRLACDPFMTFGIKAPQMTSHGYREISEPDDPVFELLKALQNRKLTGAIARSATLASYAELKPASGQLLRRILAYNLGCGLGAASLNSVRPGHVPQFGVMLASKFEEKLFSPDKRYVAEPKKDGMRAICLITHDKAHFVTRNGRPLTSLDELARDVFSTVRTSYKTSMLPTAYGDGFTPVLVLDGEVVSGNLAETLSDVRQNRRSSMTATYEVFDVIPYASFGSEACIEIPFVERRRVLEQLFAHAAANERLAMIEQRPVTTIAECFERASEWERLGFEGSMIKDLDAPYRKDRSQAWLKLKRHETEDIVVTGTFEGSGRHAGKLGGFMCDFNGVSVRVGSGLSDQERDRLWRQRDTLKGHVIEVSFQEQTSKRSLRHPRFIRFRGQGPSGTREVEIFEAMIASGPSACF